ncbi:carbonic anhydrase 13-like [Branchiostoma floridae]|uniref:Carbonic anhydrase n=1 Tax=Branchiostoma floridae TaxID=7739 RepID=A0A9J7MVG1_BRAFL|nr:carbonic anhydrase 13-like [Branchiostoma floridae]
MGCSCSSVRERDVGYPPKLVAVHYPGMTQSPVNIDTVDPLVMYCDAYLLSHPLTLQNYRPGCARRMVNDGNTFKIEMRQEKQESVASLPGHITGDSEANVPKISGGPLHDEFKLLQIHAHWGATDQDGSEHTVDGDVFQGEVHLVHMNTKYPSFEQALTKRDGLAVLGVFLQLTDEGHEGHESFKTITDKLDSISYKGDSVDLDDNFNPQCLIPDDHQKYWSYPGSLTTGGYQECVIWIIFKNTLKVSHQQLEALRSLRSYPRGKDPKIVRDPITERRLSAHILDNYRTTQPLHKRRIRASFPGNYSMYTFQKN